MGCAIGCPQDLCRMGSPGFRVPEAQEGKEWVGGKGLLVHVSVWHLWPLSQWGQGLNRAPLVSEVAPEARRTICTSSHTICPSAYFFNRKKRGRGRGYRSQVQENNLIQLIRSDQVADLA